MHAEWRSISKNTPNREKLTHTLLTLIGRCKEPIQSSIVLYGHSATGKKHTIVIILSSLKLLHISIDCKYYTSQRMLFETILSSVVKRDNVEPFSRCDNMADFVWNLKQLLVHRSQETPLFLVLDNSEYLRRLGPNIFSAFLRLKELVKLNICVILLVNGIPENLYSNSGVAEPLLMYFPQYSEDDIKQLLYRLCPFKCEGILYVNYLNIIVGSFYNICRNFSELEYIVQENFHTYCEPIFKLGVASSDGYNLWLSFVPHLTKLLQAIFLREVTLVNKPPSKGDIVTQNCRDSFSDINMPLYTKYLLIAAYLGSYNPLKGDKYVYLKKSNKRPRVLMNKKNKVNNHAVGPKPFSLHRLLSIFYSILDHDVPTLNANIITQVSSLLALGYIAIVGEDIIGKPAYRCTYNLSFISKIANSVDFNILKYLYDFMS